MLNNTDITIKCRLCNSYIYGHYLSNKLGKLICHKWEKIIRNSHKNNFNWYYFFSFLYTSKCVSSTHLERGSQRLLQLLHLTTFRLNGSKEIFTHSLLIKQDI